MPDKHANTLFKWPVSGIRNNQVQARHRAPYLILAFEIHSQTLLKYIPRKSSQQTHSKKLIPKILAAEGKNTSQAQRHLKNVQQLTACKSIN